MTRPDAYPLLADELERWRRLPRSILIAQIGEAIPPRTVRIGHEEVSIEVKLVWSESMHGSIRVSAAANGLSHWKLERFEESGTLRLSHEYAGYAAGTTWAVLPPLFRRPVAGHCVSYLPPGLARVCPKVCRVYGPSGRSFNCRSARFGTIFASYRNVMRAVFSDAGIYIYPMFLFRVFHAPFLIPWDRVVGVTTRKRFLVSWNELEVRDGDGEIHLSLGEDALREYRKFKNA